MLGQDPFANYEEWRIADMDGDGTVHVFDLTYMRRYLNLYKGTDYEGIWSPAAWKYSKLEK